ncbi:non-specific serine/threonine protein kinase [Pleurotus pulmonarius]
MELSPQPPSSSSTTPPPQEHTDIFSLTDNVLADKLTFIEEIGFGNWGSVWLCRPKANPHSPNADDVTRIQENKIAVKLVHRSKTPTTAARVRSLWNEMKIVREFKSDPHPSIIPFHSFIITPSYAMITMAYLPTLITVEVDESRARTWFRFLLSGVEFLHQRGVVHNDIKPANILLSHKNVPVLVDFGFAERYDAKSSKAFLSNLSYGTPEYLSPERARGLPHDTRKSDVWSLGVTFFEIINGRTPFELYDGEQFATKDDLERYWSRTLRGKWVGTWTMSKPAEQLLRRMLAPNADLRCTASEAMADLYWAQKPSEVSHRRSTSYNSSLAFDKDLSRVLATPSRSTKENTDLSSPPGLGSPLSRKVDNKLAAPHVLLKSKSQPKVNATKVPTIRKRVPVDLSPIKASPPTTPLSNAKSRRIANIPTFGTASGRRPLGAVSNQNGKENPPISPMYQPAKKSQVDSKDTPKAQRRALGDVTYSKRNAENMSPTTKGAQTKAVKPKDRVKERVRDWERERERLREMQRLEEFEKERDEELERERELAREREQEPVKVGDDEIKGSEVVGGGSDTENASPVGSQFTIITESVGSSSTSPDCPSPQTPYDSGLSGFKHTIQRSIDKTLHLYSSVGGKSPVTATDLGRESWEVEVMHAAKSSLPVVRQAARSERIAADNQADRLSVWMRNVEKVVEETRQTFASSVPNINAPLPPLPLAPVSRRTSQVYSNRSSRLPRRVPATQIFDQHGNSIGDQTTTSFEKVSLPHSADPTTDVFKLSPHAALHSPNRQRRATVSTRSPEPADKQPINENMTPSKRREKSKSHGNLLQLRITPISALESELQKSNTPSPTTSKRLSALVDRSLFVSTPGPSRTDTDLPRIYVDDEERSLDELTSSPLHVEPYQVRRTVNLDDPEPDPKVQRRIEGVYDRFLMATSGVKRVGRGYQSDNAGPVANSASYDMHKDKSQSHRAFYSARKPMPPPVSSADMENVIVDEMGIMTRSGGAGSPTAKDEGNTTVTLMRRAIKAIVPGKTMSRRLSRVY